jgi:hypothetical protein
MKVKLLLILFLFIAALDSYANYEDQAEDEYYLLTLGLGAGVEKRYGHTVLVRKDIRGRVKNAINWGMFSFSEDNFAFNFFLGKLRYWVADQGYDNTVHWSQVDDRRLIADKINFSEQQKQTLWKLVITNLQEDNKFFWYHYFKNNCSTIPRDYFNLALSGSLKEQLDKQITDKTYRDYVRDNLNYYPYVSFFLDIVMNSNIDYRISKWEEMFYPIKFREHLLNFPQVDDNGDTIAGTRLLGGGSVLTSGKSFASEKVSFNWIVLILGVFFILLSFLISLKYKSKILARISFFSSNIWWLWSAFLGTVMSVAWMFSGHLDLHHNVNLMIYWPSDVLLLFVNFNKLQSNSVTCIRYYLLLHIVAAILHGICGLANIIVQNISWVSVFQVPVLLMVCGICFYRLKGER